MLEQARVAFERAQDEYQRMKQVYERRAWPPNDFEKFKAVYEASRQQYEQARAGGQKEDRAQARAALRAGGRRRGYRPQTPGGRDTDRARGRLRGEPLHQVGDMASAGRPVFQIVQLDPVEISVGVPETDIHLVRTGQTAAVQVRPCPARRSRGRARDQRGGGPSTRTYMVRIRRTQPKTRLRLGMIAEAQIRGDRQLDP